MRHLKKILSLVLCFAMLVGYIPASVFAEDIALVGLCEHHTEHTGCSYSPAVEEQTCQHQCSDACYTSAEVCVHTHNGCETSDTPCDHICSEENGCMTKKLACAHEHDKVCGYAEPKDAVACDYVCPDCKKQDDIVSCDDSLSCEAEEHSDTCEKKLSDDKIAAERAAAEEAAKLAAEQAAAEAAAKAAADQAAADAVAALIDEIPYLEEIQAKPMEEQGEDYNQVNAAYNAYCALSADQQALLPPAEDVFKPYFDYFTSQTEEVAATSGTCGQNLSWKFDEATGILTISGTDAMDSYYEGNWSPWHQYRTDIEKIVIEDGISMVGSYAFYGCSNLTSVIIPNSVTFIDSFAFQNCSSLSAINIPASVTSLGLSGVFYNCVSLTTVTIPSGVTSVNWCTFNNCTSLTSVTIPVTVTSIGNQAFSGCSSLTNIYYGGTEEEWKGISIGSDNTELTNATIHYRPTWDGVGSSSQPFLISNEADLRAIADFVKRGNNCKGLYFNLVNSINLADEWIPIGTSDTYFCGTFDGNGYTISGLSASGDHVGLFAYVGGNAVIKNTTLTSVTLSGGPYIGGIAAYIDATGGTVNVTNCNVSGSITGKANGNNTYIHSGAGIVGIGKGGANNFIVITNCTNNSSVSANTYTYFGGIVGQINCGKIIGCINYDSISGSRSNDDGACFVGGICGSASSTYFTGCANYGEITAWGCAGICGGSGGRNFFSNCLNAGDIQHHSDGTGYALSYDGYNYENCYYSECGLTGGWYGDPTKTGTKITSEQLSSGEVAYKMGGYFGQVIGLDYRPVRLTANNKVYQLTITGAIDCTVYATHNKTVNWPAEFESYTLKNNDKDFEKDTPITQDYTLMAVKEEVISGTCGENLTWVLVDGVLTISGTGAMKDFALNTIPWANYRNSIQAVKVLDGVTTIGAQAFYEFSKIESIDLPDSITTIGNWAFNNCVSLSSIRLPENLTTIGTYAFIDCTGIEVVSIPDSVTVLGKHAFNGCTSLTTIELSKNISSIDEFTFADCKMLTSISIPDGVNNIGDAAFAQCAGLTEISIPSSVLSIGWRTFVDCSGLSEIWFEGNAPAIDAIAFEGLCADVIVTAYYPADNDTWTADVMQNYGGTITWKPYGNKHVHEYNDNHVCECGAIGGTCNENLTWILDNDGILTISGTGAMENFHEPQDVPWYQNTEDIQRVVIKEGVTGIGSYAFYSCNNLISVTIPDSVTTIGSYVFYNCNKLMSADMPDNITAIGTSTFHGCSSLTSVTIPAGVTLIDSGIFKGCSALISVTLPDGVTTISDAAFSGCSALTSITIPNSVTSIRSHAFYDCSQLSEITIPQGVLFIESSTFRGCSNLSSIIIPDSVTSIGDLAFYHCTSLTEIVIPNNVTSIGGSAFSGCSSLTSVKIPNSVTTAGSSAFFGCSSLTSVEISDGMNSVSKSMFSNCKVLTSIAIPDSVTSIEESAFKWCSNLKNVNLGDGCSLGDEVFWDCPVETLELGETASFGENVFNSGNLKSITISANNSSFEDGSFWGCTNLEAVHFTGSAPTRVKENGVGSETSTASFRGVTFYYDCGQDGWTTSSFYNAQDKTWARYDLRSETHVEVTDKAVAATCTQTGLTEGKRCSVCQEVIVAQTEIPAGHNVTDSICTVCGIYGICGENLTWIFDEKTCTLRISGNGDMDGYSSSDEDTPWSNFADEILSIVVEEGVNSLGTYVFHDCTVLNSVVLPESLTLIDWGAFSGCSSLSSIEIPENVTEIGGSAFHSCVALTSISIPANVTYIDPDAFMGCDNLSGIWVDEENTKYANDTYGVLFNKNMTELVKYPEGLSGAYSIPHGVTTIGMDAFVGSQDLTEVTIPDTVSEISSSGFMGCNLLKNVIIPGSVTKIDGMAFAFCDSLESITFKDNAPSLSAYVFAETTATAYYPIKNSTWTSAVKQNYGGNITWKPYGNSATKLILSGLDPDTYLGQMLGREDSIMLQAVPSDATVDMAYSVSDSSILEITEQSNFSCSVIAHKPGTVTLTATDKLSGISIAREITIIAPKAITIPFEDEIPITSSFINGYYSFTPTVTGRYIFSSTACEKPYTDSLNIYIAKGNSGNLADGYVYPNEDEIQVYADLNAGVTYQVQPQYSGITVGRTAKFSVNYLDAISSVSGINFQYDNIECEWSVQDRKYPIYANLLPAGSTGTLIWETSDSSIVEISSSNNDSCHFIPRKAGKATITASCGNVSNSVNITVNDPHVLTLNQPVSVTHDKGTLQHIFAFTPTESGRYVFSVDSGGEYHPREITVHSDKKKITVDMGYGKTTFNGYAQLESGETYYIGIGNSVFYPSYVGCTVTVSRSIGVPKSLQLRCVNKATDNTQFILGAYFAPENTHEKIVKWEVSDESILNAWGHMDSYEEVFDIIGQGKVTVTATSESGLTASYNYYVDAECVYGYAGGACGETLEWEFNEESKTLKIYGTGAMYSYHHVTNVSPWNVYRNDIEKVIVEEGITSIGSFALSNLSNLNNIMLPNSLISIESGAFYNCTELERIVLPSGLTHLGNAAFQNCTNLKGITIPAGITNLEENMFVGCTSLSSVALPNTLTSLGDMAFWNCSSLEDIVLPDSLTIIGNGVFAYCRNLRDVTLPNNVSSIGNSAFAYCTSLVDFTIPGTITNIGDSTFCGCSSLQSINLHDKITSIGMFAFQKCTSLRTIDLPDNLVSIGTYAFSLCSNLSSIKLPDGVTRISGCAFWDCISLSTISLPDNITHIDTGAFAGCVSLKEVYFAGNPPIICNENNGQDGSFKECILTAYYPADNAGWTTDVQKGYGGDIIWKPYGNPATKLTLSGLDADTYLGQMIGRKDHLLLTTVPADATVDMIYTVTDSSVLEIVDYNDSACWVIAHKPGTVTVTATDKLSGISTTEEITIVTPKEIAVPFEEDISITSSFVNRYYSFTPTVTGRYVFSSTACEKPYTDALNIYIANGDSGTLAFGWEYPAGDKCQVYADLEAGVTYQVQPQYSGITVGRTAKFKAAYLGEAIAVTGVSIKAPDQIECEYWPTNDKIYASGSFALEAERLPAGSKGTILWESSDNSIIAVKSSSNTYGGFTTKSCGTATITATCNGYSDSVTITVKDPEELTVDQWEEVTHDYGNTSHIFKFTPQKTGEYVITMDSEDAYYPQDIIEVTTDGAIVTCPEYGYGVDTQKWYLELEAGKTYYLKVGVSNYYYSPNIPSYKLKIVESDGIPEAMYLRLLKQTENTVDFGTYFDSENSHEEIVDVKISDESVLQLAGASYGVTTSHKLDFKVIGAGEVTVTATTESGLEASYTLYVGEKPGNNLNLEEAALSNETTVWIDGIPYPVQKDNSGKAYVELPEGVEVSNMVTYGFHVGDPNDIHTQYPVSMKVWMLKKDENGIYQAHYVKELDNILQYSGSSIRITGNKGIRMITSVEANKKSAMTGADLAGYKLVEYGTVLAQSSKMTGPLTLGQSYARSNYAYKRGVADPVFAHSGNLVQYTNVLVGFSLEQCKEDIAMRPYMILEDAAGKQETIYGGIVYRSIGYIAYQNRGVFGPGSAAYNYVWEIIHHVYGNKYDADYKG